MGVRKYDDVRLQRRQLLALTVTLDAFGNANAEAIRRAWSDTCSGLTPFEPAA